MILVLRVLKLGDLLVTVPAMRALRRHWPDQRIVLACQGWLRPVVELTGCVDTLLPTFGMAPLPRSVGRPDVAVNLHGAGPASTRVLTDLEPARLIGHSGPDWVDDLHERDRWCRLLEHAGVPADPADLLLARPAVASPVPGAVVVHPGAAYGSKRWPPDRFARVVADLARQGHDVVVTGSAAERELAETVAERSGARPRVLAGGTGLAELAALVADAALVVTGDTGTAHLAYAYRTPAVMLFGPASPRHWGPPPGPHVALSVDELRRGDPFADEPDPALLGISVDAVLAAVREVSGVSRGAWA